MFAVGTATHEFRPSGDHYVHEHRFQSPDLRERYGDPVVEYEPSKIPRAQLSDELDAEGTTVRKVRDRQVIGTPTEQASGEELIREKRRNGRVDAQTHLTDEVPLYHYENAEDAGNKQNRKAPINVGWKNAASAKWVDSETKSKCNWSQPYDFVLPDVPRYINFDGDVSGTDRHMTDRLVDLPGIVDEAVAGMQAHVRLYDVASSETEYDVVGQAHVDPPDHNQICKYTGVACNPWHFDAARDLVEHCWTADVGWGHYDAYLSNGGDWDTHDGWACLLEN